MSTAFGLAVLVVAVCAPGAASSDMYHVTGAEKAACTADATRLCLSTYPDEDRLLSCMAANRSSLTPTCLVVFDVGVKRRRLVAR